MGGGDELPAPKHTVTQLSTRQQGIIARLDAGDVLRPEDLAAFAAPGYNARRAGRLVFEVPEAETEYGVEVARRLKVDESANNTILWPQPHSLHGAPDPNDPQNWSHSRKTVGPRLEPVRWR